LKSEYESRETSSYSEEDIFSSFSVDFTNGMILFVDLKGIFDLDEVRNLNEVVEGKDDIASIANWFNRSGYGVILFCSGWISYFKTKFYKWYGYFDNDIEIEKL